MAEITVSDIDFEKATSQVALLKEMLVDYEVHPTDNAEIISKIKSDIAEIEAEARAYDQLLNPRPMPEICRLCNGHPKVDMPTKPCPECGVNLVQAQPAEGFVHWKIPDQAVGVALAPGVNPP